MLWMIRRRGTTRYVTDSRTPGIVPVQWGPRGDAEMFTQQEHDTAAIADTCEWVGQGSEDAMLKQSDIPSIKGVDVRAFVDAYIECALWSSTDDEDEPFDRNHGPEDLSPEALDRINAECRAFLYRYGPWITAETCLTRLSAAEQAGHDFWLTRNGHGAGFWETSDWRESAGELLTKGAKSFGEVNVIKGEDGLLYVE